MAEVVLPEELIVGIFLRLPVRSLLRFSCVCKSWKTLISNSRFVKDHLHNSVSGTSMTHQQVVSLDQSDGHGWKMVTCSVQSLFENRSTPPRIHSFRVGSEDPYPSIVGSCNGLVCLCDSDGCFRLWNPSTRMSSTCVVKSRCLIRHCGFGYDQVNDKYKVLIISSVSPNPTQVHTFGTNSWTTIQTSSGMPARPEWYDVGKFVSGKLNWLAEGRGRIISFDLEKETYGEVSLPPADGAGSRKRLSYFYNCINAVSDRLCYSYTTRIHCVVWLMKKYGIQESWTKLTVIHNWKLMIGDAPFLHPLCISENGVLFAKSYDLQLVIYDTSNGEFDYCKSVRNVWYTQIYHESLVSPL